MEVALVSNSTGSSSIATLKRCNCPKVIDRSLGALRVSTDILHPLKKKMLESLQCTMVYQLQADVRYLLHELKIFPCQVISGTHSSPVIFRAHNEEEPNSKIALKTFIIRHIPSSQAEERFHPISILAHFRRESKSACSEAPNENFLPCGGVMEKCR